MIKIEIQAGTIKEIHSIIREILGNTDATGVVEVAGFVATPTIKIDNVPPPVVVDDGEFGTGLHEQVANVPVVADIPAPIAPPVVDDVAPPTTNEFGADLDADGAVWDARIHSTGKSKTKAGVWKILRKPKRFETDEEWKKYVGEIQQIAAVDDEPIQDIPVNPVLHTTQSVQNIPPVELNPIPLDGDTILPENMPSTFGDIPPPEENVLAPITDFNEFINFITNGPCPMEYNLVLEIAKKHGMVNSMMEFGTPANIGKIPLMYNEIMGIA